MIEFKKGGLFERFLTVYGCYRTYELTNFCAIFWGALRGSLVVMAAVLLPVCIVMFDMFLVFTILYGIEGEAIAMWIETTPPVAHAILSILHISALIVSIACHLLVVGVLLAYCWVVSYEFLSQPIAQYKQGKLSSVVKEVYQGIKNKYCPTIVWVNKGDK
jgi:hypothetical protein